MLEIVRNDPAALKDLCAPNGLVFAKTVAITAHGNDNCVRLVTGYRLVHSMGSFLKMGVETMKAFGIVVMIMLVTACAGQQRCHAVNKVVRLEGDPESYFAAPDDDSLDVDLNIAFTVEAWVNPDKTEGENMVLNKEDVYEISINNGILQTAIQPIGQGWAWLGSEGEVFASEWTHIAATWDGEIASTFVNGEFMNSFDLFGDGANNSPDTFKVGRRTRGGDTHSIFTGMIDEVRISKVVRYTEDGFEVPRSAFIADDDTVALYHFDESINGVVRDASGRGNDGMLINDAVLVEDEFLLPAGQGRTLGDFNEDGAIDLADFQILTSNFGTSGNSFAEGDINFDSRVDLSDFLQFRGVFSATGNGVAAVPEPHSLAMISLAGGALLLLIRRREIRA